MRDLSFVSRGKAVRRLNCEAVGAYSEIAAEIKGDVHVRLAAGDIRTRRAVNEIFHRRDVTAFCAWLGGREIGKNAVLAYKEYFIETYAEECNMGKFNASWHETASTRHE